jgi:DNA-binding CsgD family transcriptional regulator
LTLNGTNTVLTDRQREVLALVRRGHSNREIGTELGITEEGVKAHLSRLYLRFGVSNRIELLSAADVTATEGGPDARASLGTLRAIAGRTDLRASTLEASRSTTAVSAKLAEVRDALAAMDAALGLVSDLPAETTGPIIEVVRKRLASAVTALDDAQRTAESSRSA